MKTLTRTIKKSATVTLGIVLVGFFAVMLLVPLSFAKFVIEDQLINKQSTFNEGYYNVARTGSEHRKGWHGLRTKASPTNINQ